MPKSILIIEDDPDILEIMDCILDAEGFRVIASKVCQPIQQIVALKPDLILMDNRLSDCFGKDACRKLKETKDTAHIPVILVSANNGLEEMAVANHADGFLNKPFDVSELVGLARRWVSKVPVNT